jgi:hypothetical protein
MDLQVRRVVELQRESTWRCLMANVGRDQDFDEILIGIGPDATAIFDDSPSDPTRHAGAVVDDEDEELEEEDDDAAALEEDDEMDEEEDVEDEAGV